METLLGGFATLLTILIILPQIIKAWRTKRTRDVALWSFIFSAVGAASWTIYGVLRHDNNLIAANSIVCCLAITMLILKRVYD